MGNMKTLTVLIIDDEPSILKLLKIWFSKIGYIADTTVDGKNGLKKMDDHTYDLILTDIKMPGISGDQIFDYSRNVLESHTPIIGMPGTPWLIDDN